MMHSQSVFRSGYIASCAISIVLLVAGVVDFIMTNGDIRSAQSYVAIAICVAFASAVLRRFVRKPDDVTFDESDPPSGRRSSPWRYIAALCCIAVGVSLVLMQRLHLVASDRASISDSSENSRTA